MGRWTSSGWQEGYIFFFFLHFPETGFALVEIHCRQENIKWIFKKLSKRILHCWRHTAPHETKGLIQANILFQRPPTPPPQEWRKENLNKNQTGGHLSPECHFPNNTNIKYWLLNRTATLGNEKKKIQKNVPLSHITILWGLYQTRHWCVCQASQRLKTLRSLKK